MKSLFVAFFSLVAVTSARPVHLWTYSELCDKSDQVVIATAAKKLPITDQILPKGFPKETIAYQITFKILTAIKGKSTENINIAFYALPKSDKPVINAPGFVDVDTSINNRYLMFLKDGVPISGYIDPIFAIRKLESWSEYP